jgi:predicted ATPase
LLTPASAEYAFHHPLIRAVVYESQLKSDRAEWHLRLAVAIRESAPGSVEDNAALIAEHLQAAGELRAAYAWHMRAAASSANRDVNAARQLGAGTPHRRRLGNSTIPRMRQPRP